MLSMRLFIATTLLTAIGIKMAGYGSKEKAKKAMEMLRADFCDYGESGVFQFPAEEELE